MTPESSALEFMNSWQAENGPVGQNPGRAAQFMDAWKSYQKKMSEPPTISSADDVLEYLKEASKIDPVSKDIYFNYLLSEKSAGSARAWEEEQNSKRYQTMVNDMKKAGLNPYWLNSLGGAADYSTSGNKYSGSAYETQYRDRSTAKKNDVMNIAKIAGIVSSAIAITIALL